MLCARYVPDTRPDARKSEEEEATVLVLTDPRLVGRDKQVIIKTEEHRMGGMAAAGTQELRC